MKWIVIMLLFAGFLLVITMAFLIPAHGQNRTIEGIKSHYPLCNVRSVLTQQGCWRLSAYYRSIPEWAKFGDSTRWSYWEICRAHYCVPYAGNDEHVEDVLAHGDDQ